MTKWIALCFALAISLSAVAKEPTPTVFNTYAYAEVVIEPDARVSDIKFVGTKLGSALESILVAKIRAPNLLQAGLLNGKPARTNSMLLLQLRAESDLKNKQTLFTLHNISVSTMPLPNSRNRMIYPETMLRWQREAKIVVQVNYDAKGAVTDAHVDTTQPKVHIDFERSALRYARNLKFFVEKVGEVRQGGSVFIPVVYKMLGPNESPAFYSFKLPTGESLDMYPGEPAAEVIPTKMQASLIKPFVPQALTGG